jgi:hypothetical protein
MHRSVAVMVRAGYGAALVVVPGRVLAAVGAGDAGRGLATVARVLGARELVEAAMLQFRSSARSAARSVDTAHVATMVGVAAAGPDLRRVALASAAVDAALAIGDAT